MSLSALLISVRDNLRTDLGLADSECGIQDDGQPPETAGEIYVAVHGADWSNDGIADHEEGLGELYAVTVTITKRVTAVPHDRRADEVYVKATLGIEAVARKVIKTIHKSVTVMADANRVIDTFATDEQGAADEQIVEPLRWQSASPVPTQVGPDWFGAATQDTRIPPRPEGLVMTVQFAEARRIQTKATMA